MAKVRWTILQVSAARWSWGRVTSHDVTILRGEEPPHQPTEAQHMLSTYLHYLLYIYTIYYTIYSISALSIFACFFIFALIFHLCLCILLAPCPRVHCSDAPREMKWTYREYLSNTTTESSKQLKSGPQDHPVAVANHNLCLSLWLSSRYWMK